MIYPKLKQGGTVRMIGVSGTIRSDDAAKVVSDSAEKLRGLGFQVQVDDSCLQKHGYLSGTDSVRADAFNRAFADDSVDGVWCIRGGYGCIRMADGVDWDMVAAHPKPLIGYSDITTLHIMLQNRGIVSFHGPMPSTDSFTGASLDSLMHAITGNPDKVLQNPDGTGLETVIPGQAEGVLVGGNLTLVTSSVGTPYDLDVKGKLLFLEDIGEDTYVLDRYFHQLLHAGKLHECAGIILGGFTDITVEHPEAGLTLNEVFDDVFAKVHVPVVKGLQAGHLKEKLTLPLGCRYKLDAGRGIITLAE
ncbi:MAG: LD-carboxypeptidase [Clostridia bacterium]|nr:LD-carboxypeptidase [Clostridia bacterium]